MSRLRFLGTGWSHGVPMIGCDCPVCTDPHPKNIRRRPSIQIQDQHVSVVVDVGPDFRDQALTFGIERLDAVFITHQHADHVMGMDDVRRLTWIREAPVPVWAEPAALDRLRILYPYVAEERTPASAVPRLRFKRWTEPVEIGSLRFQPIPVPHGSLPCVGVRIDTPRGSVGYVPDCSDLPPSALRALKGVDIMILNALRKAPHPSHLAFDRSRVLLEEINAPRSYFTHMGCPLDYREIQPTLPDGLDLAWDGLVVDV